VARNIVAGWLLTLPAAATVSGAVYGIVRLFGDGVTGPIVVSLSMIVAGFALWRANRGKSVEPEETISENPTFGRCAPALEMPA
jgi:hypothetical protein